jgi:hypothetical protein
MSYTFKTSIKLDKILKILFNKKLLQSYQVSSKDFISDFLKQKHNIDWDDPKITYLLNLLQNDGYIIVSNVINLVNYYSLTAKGINIKQHGGFTVLCIKQNIKENIRTYAALVALITFIIISIPTCIQKYSANNTINKQPISYKAHTNTIPARKLR